jgi:hypothetical protein
MKPALAIAALFPLTVPLPLLAQQAPSRPQGVEVVVNNWPQDVPCDILERTPDGGWTTNRPVVINGGLHIGKISVPANGGEGRVWAQKCEQR